MDDAGDGRPSIISAAETAQRGSPFTNARVPSIGSTTMRLRRARRSKSSTVSSESQPASGSASRKRRLSSESAARSAAVTGEPPALVSTRAEVRAPGLKYSNATAPASRAAEAKRSRAASASVSASTFKGGMSAAKRKVCALGFSRARRRAQSRNARACPRLPFRPRHSAAAAARSARQNKLKF